MPKCVIDGQEVEFSPGENLIEIARKAGIEIPYFCYHPGLSIVAQCRMCAVEIEKSPKLQTACSTPVVDGMIVKTASEKAKQNQKSIMEFLLLNHPLDCPICDKAGDCDLQDNSFKFGDMYMRSAEDRRTYLDLDMGPVIKKNMNRCIHCTRCIRFGAEVAGIREMVAVQRGNNTEITTIDGKALETDYAGNYSDICPTGSLTLKDFRFRKRSWMLKRTATICEGCSRGCSIELQQDNNVIFRTVARENLAVNKYWICDEGRFNYHHVHDSSRHLEPSIQKGGSFQSASWSVAVEEARNAIQGKPAVILLGTDLTQEEAQIVRGLAATTFGGASVFHFGTPGVKTAAEDAPADKLLKRKSKTANLHGLEKLGIKPFEGLGSAKAAVVFTSGKAVLPALSGATVVGVGVFRKEETTQFAVILPGTTFAEKDGTIVNFEGQEQKLKRALLPVGKSKQLAEIMMMWSNKK